MIYMHCCMLGFIHFQSVINLFTFVFSFNRSTNVSKKIVFSGRQKSVRAAILFDKFWLVRWVFRATWQCVWMRRVGFHFYNNLTPSVLNKSSIQFAEPVKVFLAMKSLWFSSIVFFCPLKGVSSSSVSIL